MNKIGLSLTINKFTTYFESIPHFLMFETLDKNFINFEFNLHCGI